MLQMRGQRSTSTPVVYIIMCRELPPVSCCSVTFVTDAVADSSEVNRDYDVLVKCGVKVIDGLSLSLEREPKDFAVVLHSKGFIAKQILQEIVQLPATSTENGRMLYTAILGVVEHYPYRYREFISILQDNQLLYGDLLKVLGEDLDLNGE